MVGGVQPGHGLLGKVAASVLPLMVLLLENCGGEPQQGSAVGEDARHLRPAIILGVHPLQGVGGADGAPVLSGKRQVGEYVLLGVAQQPGYGVMKRASRPPTLFRVNSSPIERTLTPRPSAVGSKMKSSTHTWLGRSARSRRAGTVLFPIASAWVTALALAALLPARDAAAVCGSLSSIPCAAPPRPS